MALLGAIFMFGGVEGVGVAGPFALSPIPQIASLSNLFVTPTLASISTKPTPPPPLSPNTSLLPAQGKVTGKCRYITKGKELRQTQNSGWYESPFITLRWLPVNCFSALESLHIASEEIHRKSYPSPTFLHPNPFFNETKLFICVCCSFWYHCTPKSFLCKKFYFVKEVFFVFLPIWNSNIFAALQSVHGNSDCLCTPHASTPTLSRRTVCSDSPSNSRSTNDALVSCYHPGCGEGGLGKIFVGNSLASSKHIPKIKQLPGRYKDGYGN